MNISTTRPRAPVWLLVIAALGVAWNIFGIVQFIGSLQQTEQSLMMGGMTAAQAEVYYGLPAWTKIAFAIGVGGGLLGSIAMLLRRREASAVLLASLIAYVALWIGDLAYGVFAALPSQMAILSTVVAIAVALFVTARAALVKHLLA